MLENKRIAIVHDWLVSMRGGEKVVEALCEIFPQAKLFTLVHRKGALSPIIERMNIRTSFLQHLPLAVSHHQYYLPLYRSAIERLPLDGFDLVISSSSAVAKGVRIPPGIAHICYCHTPMRYIWDQYDEYFGPGRASLPVRFVMKLMRGSLRRWDRATADGVTHFVANSRNVQERVKRIYGRESVVIYPPVDVDRFTLSNRDDGYYLIVSALVPYKRIDLAVEAFNRLGKRLLIVGTGSEETGLRRMARPNIEFVGWAGEEELNGYYAGCRALVFPGEEDFGIAPVEAMACGKPVIAFGRGGVVETVREGETGVFISQPRAESLESKVMEFEKMRFDPVKIRENAMRFGRQRFKNEMERYLVGRLPRL